MFIIIFRRIENCKYLIELLYCLDILVLKFDIIVFMKIKNIFF